MLGGIRHRLVEALGGAARARVVLVLGAALGLDGADEGTLSTMAGPLKAAFHIGNTQIGLLASVVSLVSALCTLPVGVLTDRVRRTRLLAVSTALWAAATALSALAPSYLWLLVSRAALGAVTATTGPTIASLIGDFFPIRERARIYGTILAGELVGTGVGFAVSGAVGSALGWRFAFWWLVVPGALLVWAVARLPEPARGGQSRLRAGQEDILDAREVAAADAEGDAAGGSAGGGPAAGDGERDPDRDRALGRDPDLGRGKTADARSDAVAGTETGTGRGSDTDTGDDPAPDRDLAGQAVRESGVAPDPRLVLRRDPRTMPLWQAVGYVLRIRTNLVVIIASALGYFFFAGLRSFASLFTTQHYGVSTAVAGILVLIVGAGALAGVLLGGRVADRLLGRGRANARVLVPTVCLLALPLLAAPALHSTDFALALPLLICSTALLGAANPPLDAARLDIVHPYLWGRAEGVRTMLRTLGQAAAPTLFGWVSAHVFDGPEALQYTLLLFLLPLVGAGALGLVAMRTYPRDVATADASARVVAGEEE
ncbi:MFS transporter [Streptomyces sp. L2]|uniref:MFS transporter n=1 Tax=Streptomyces sp. L2 TaxID=2162665 RepID=UPI0013E92AC7|nr:MFS transporter [Streptomyces sp. L2]